jgi:hypothetical protein
VGIVSSFTGKLQEEYIVNRTINDFEIASLKLIDAKEQGCDLYNENLESAREYEWSSKVLSHIDFFRRVADIPHEGRVFK